VDSLPAASVAVQCTSVLPRGKKLPDGGTHTTRGEDFRADVAALLAKHDLPVSVTGYGSMMSLHARRPAPTTPAESMKRDHHLQELRKRASLNASARQ